MRICEVLGADHDEARTLFDELAPLAADDRRSTHVMRLAARLAIVLKTHALAEERVLYAVLITAGDRCAACALEGPYELRALDIIIDKLLALRPGPDFRAALAVARRLFEHHVQHELQELVPAVTAAFPDDECRSLGSDLLAEQRRVRPQVARRIEV